VLVDNMLIFAFSMMYSGVCPIATFVCLLYFVFISYMDEKLLTFWIQRSFEPYNIGMDLWMKVVEFMVFFIVIMNSIIVFTVSVSFREYLSKFVDDEY
jgi:hypothetical protein